MIICVVKDTKLGMYLKPFAIEDSRQAVREFIGAVKGTYGKNQIQSNPEDYALILVGKVLIAEHDVETPYGKETEQTAISIDQQNNDILITGKQALETIKLKEEKDAKNAIS